MKSSNEMLTFPTEWTFKFVSRSLEDKCFFSRKYLIQLSKGY